MICYTLHNGSLDFSPSNGPELCCGVLGLLSFDPVSKEPLRRNATKRRMATIAVVKLFDVLEQIGLRVLMRPVARGVNPFVLQAVEEAFRRDVVPTISLAAHRAAHVVGGQFALELVTRVQAAPIRVAPCAESGTAAKPCHRQHVRHESRRHTRLGGPADSLPVRMPLFFLISSSICSGLTGFDPAPLCSPVASTFTQLRSVCSEMPSSRATMAIPRPSSTRLLRPVRTPPCTPVSVPYTCVIAFLSVEFIHDILEGEISGDAHTVTSSFLLGRRAWGVRGARNVICACELNSQKSIIVNQGIS